MVFAAKDSVAEPSLYLSKMLAYYSSSSVYCGLNLVVVTLKSFPSPPFEKLIYFECPVPIAGVFRSFLVEKNP